MCDGTQQSLVVGVAMRRNSAYGCGIISFTHLARSRRRSRQKSLDQIGKLHPVGHAQKQTPFTHHDFRIRASEIGPSHRNRPNLAAVRLQQKPLAIAIVSLAHAVQLPLEQWVKRVRDTHKLFICDDRGCTSA
jgi:hypothetical protein